MLLARLLHHLAKMVLHKHSRGRHLAHFDVAVEVIEAVDGDFLAQVLKFCLK